MSRDPIKLTIGLGFTGVLALMGLISFISLSQMNDITEKMSVLLEETNAKTSAANTMRDSIRLRGNVLYKMHLTDDYIERDELRLQLATHGLNYLKAKDTLSSYHMGAREAKLLDQIIKKSRTASEYNDTAADNLLSDMPKEEMQSYSLKANEARQDMLNSLNRLVELQEKNTHSIINDTKEYQETIGSIILFLSLAAFFIALYIAQLVIRETTRKNSEIHFQATHDELTKLVNRKEFNHRLKEAYNTARDEHETHALCFLDLDNFKTINDSCGHKAGDELLIQLTQTVKSNIRSHDILARIGGDEFGLLLEGCSLDKAAEIAEGIVSLVKNYEFNWQGKTFHVGVSIGLVMITRATQSIEKALSQADIACYVAKDMGRNQVHIHGLDDKLIKKMHKELSWVANINNDDKKNHFSLHLQAIKDIQEDQNIPMYEVLLRLNDDEGTLVSPGSYIPAAERFSLMKDVDHWVIKKTFKKLSKLYQAIPDCNVRLFIKISADSLINHDFSDFVIRQYKKHNITHDAVCLEISEIKAVKNINQTAEVISKLRKYNIKFALDDFGSGVSSFSYLKTLAVDYLKIDGNIIKNISRNTTDKAMVAAVNQIGKVMNIKIIAKHVEDVFTLNQLKEIGIDYAQGFFLDEPKQIDKCVTTLKESILQHSVKH
jgi:diguanylate cyclase (GGDEF)-like protein